MYGYTAINRFTYSFVVRVFVIAYKELVAAKFKSGIWFVGQEYTFLLCILSY